MAAAPVQLLHHALDLDVDLDERLLQAHSDFCIVVGVRVMGHTECLQGTSTLTLRVPQGVPQIALNCRQMTVRHRAGPCM